MPTGGPGDARGRGAQGRPGRLRRGL